MYNFKNTFSTFRNTKTPFPLSKRGNTKTLYICRYQEPAASPIGLIPFSKYLPVLQYNAGFHQPTSPPLCPCALFNPFEICLKSPENFLHTKEILRYPLPQKKVMGWWVGGKGRPVGIKNSKPQLAFDIVLAVDV